MSRHPESAIQPRRSRVTFEEEELEPLSLIHPVQLTASESVLSQIAESTQDLTELRSAESADSIISSEAEQRAESQEDEYGDKFEADEPIADQSNDSSHPEALAQKMYDNPLGPESSESATDSRHEEASSHVTMLPSAAAHAVLPIEASPHGPHVATQLTVSDQGSVRLNYGLDEEEGSVAHAKQVVHSHDSTSQVHMDPHEAEAHEAHVATKMIVSGNDSVKVQCKLEPEDAAEEEIEDATARADLLEDQGASMHQPFTPMAYSSVFTASANMSDNVDIFSKTLPAPKESATAAAATLAEVNAASEPEFGQHLARVRSGLKQESEFESGRELTPSYRRQDGRSLQQAHDNEQPFSAAWRGQTAPEGVTQLGALPDVAPAADYTAAPASEDLTPAVTKYAAEPVADSTTMGVAESGQHAAAKTDAQVHKDVLKASPAEASPALAPTPAIWTPSRQSSVSVGANLADYDRQPSLSTAGLTLPAKQSSLSMSAASDSAGKSGAYGFPATLPSQTSLSTQFSLSKLGSGSLSKQPSYLNLPASGFSSRRSSFSARLERETSQVFPRQPSNAALAAAAAQPAFASRTASLSGSSNPLLSPQVSGVNLVPASAASHTASRVPSRQPSFSKPASLGPQASQVSRQPSTASASDAASRMPSRQPSFSQSASLSRQASQVSSQPTTLAASEAASAALSRQSSVSRQGSMSQRTTYVPQSNSGNPAVAEATSNVSSRQPSFTRPASASRTDSRSLQPQSSGGNFPLSRSTSKLPSRQQSVSASAQSGFMHSQGSKSPAAFSDRAEAVMNVEQASPSSHAISQGTLAAQLKPASRAPSMSSLPRRSDSLEAMHRQMSLSRKSSTVEEATGTPTGHLPEIQYTWVS